MSLSQQIREVLTDYPGGATIEVIQEELEDRGHITFHDLDRATDLANKMARARQLARRGERRTYIFSVAEGQSS